jgi:hypothetical protein
MFVAILSSLHTGQVRRRSFTTWDKARDYADNWLSSQLRRGASARDYCVEIQYIEAKPSECPNTAARKHKLAA